MKTATCHPHKKAKGRGLCGACYDKVLKAENPKYKEAQKSSTTRWCLANPEKYEIIKKRRQQKEKEDPKTPENKYRQLIKRKYNLEYSDYLKMRENQKECCALCNRKEGKKKLHVDHCHTTGTVRGLLCHQCNWYLGTIDNDPDIVTRIIKYRKGTGEFK